MAWPEGVWPESVGMTEVIRSQMDLLEKGLSWSSERQIGVYRLVLGCSLAHSCRLADR